MPSVLFVNRVFPPDRGATGRLIAEVADHLRALGWSAGVLCCGASDDTVWRAGVRVDRVAAPAGQGWRDSLDQVAALGRGLASRPVADVTVMLSDPPLLGLLGWLVKARGGASVHWVQDLYPDLFDVVAPGAAPSAASLREAGAAALMPHDRIVTIDEAMAAAIARYGVAPEAVAVAPNWADAWAAAKPGRGAADGRRWHNTGRRRLHVVHAGSLGRVHNMAGVLDALALLAGEAPHIRFTLAGGGSARPALEAGLGARGLGATVDCQPWLDDAALRRLIASADLALAVMDRRAQGMVMPCKAHLALALGRPLAFCGPADTGFARRLVEVGAGVVLPPDDPRGLAATLMRLSGDPAALAHLAAGARSDAAFHGHDAGVRRFAGHLAQVVRGTPALRLSRIAPPLPLAVAKHVGLCLP